jgi:hypothetical protein
MVGNMKAKRVASFFVFLSMVFIALPMLQRPAGAEGQNIVISQIYGGGGTATGIYGWDFIELYNPTGISISIEGWAVQYASAYGTSWSMTALTGIIRPHSYYLIKESGNGTGTRTLPTPDATGVFAMSLSSGKVALTSYNYELMGSNPSGDPNVVDFVGYGSTNAYEGSLPTATLSPATAAWRETGVVIADTNNNGNDFIVKAPYARNSLSPEITDQPDDWGVPAGTAVSLSLTVAESAGAVSYQWYSSPSDVTYGGTQIQGAGGPTYAPPTGTMGTTYYYCVVTCTDTPGEQTSRAAKVTVDRFLVLTVTLNGTKSVLYLPPGQARTVVYAVFSANGKMLGVGLDQVDAQDRASITLTTVLPPGYTTKLILLDENYKPL